LKLLIVHDLSNWAASPRRRAKADILARHAFRRAPAAPVSIEFNYGDKRA